MAERRKRINLYVGPRESIKREDLARYEESGDWVAEEKKDGVWCLLTIESGVVVEQTSRTNGKLTGPLLGRRIADKGTGQLAGELVADVEEGDEGTERTGTRRLHLFEPLFWNDLDLRDLPLEDRREALNLIYDQFELVRDDKCSGLLYIVERRATGFTDWYDSLVTSVSSRVIGARAEGLVLKKRGTIARASTADGKVDYWVRCKPKNTIDYVVIGPDGAAAKGTPKIALGLYKQTKDGVRVVKVMSPTWPKGMDLKEGDVVEVEGAEVFPSGAVRHGYIKRVRTDKAAKDCTYESAVRS